MDISSAPVFVKDTAKFVGFVLVWFFVLRIGIQYKYTCKSSRLWNLAGLYLQRSPKRRWEVSNRRRVLSSVPMVAPKPPRQALGSALTAAKCCRAIGAASGISSWFQL